MIIKNMLSQHNLLSSDIINKYSKNFFLNTGINKLLYIIYSPQNKIKIFSSDHILTQSLIQNDLFSSYENIKNKFLTTCKELKKPVNTSYIFEPQNIHLHCLTEMSQINKSLKLIQLFKNFNFKHSLSAFRQQNSNIIIFSFSSLLVRPYMCNINNAAIIKNFINQFEQHNAELLNNLVSFKTNYTQNKNDKLTRREFECLTELSKYKTSKEVALSLNISYRTVQTHLQNIKNKLGIYSKAELIRCFKEI